MILHSGGVVELVGGGFDPAACAAGLFLTNTFSDKMSFVSPRGELALEQ